MHIDIYDSTGFSSDPARIAAGLLPLRPGSLMKLCTLGWDHLYGGTAAGLVELRACHPNPVVVALLNEHPEILILLDLEDAPGDDQAAVLVEELRIVAEWRAACPNSRIGVLNAGYGTDFPDALNAVIDVVCIQTAIYSGGHFSDPTNIAEVATAVASKVATIRAVTGKPIVWVTEWLDWTTSLPLDDASLAGMFEIAIYYGIDPVWWWGGQSGSVFYSSATWVWASNNVLISQQNPDVPQQFAVTPTSLLPSVVNGSAAIAANQTMASADQYAGRTVDVLAFAGQQLGKEMLLQQVLAQNGLSGTICTGIQKLAQRWLLEFLTENGSMEFLPGRGCPFMRYLSAGQLRTTLDVEQAFYLSAAQIKLNLRGEDAVGDPIDEVLDQANLLNLTIADGLLAVHVNVLSQAGTGRSVILPLTVTIG